MRAEERNIALERVKKEIANAKEEAERAARKAIEAESNSKAQEEKKEQEMLARVEARVRERFEAEQRAKAEKRRGFGLSRLGFP